jgi:hypothetical protein
MNTRRTFLQCTCIQTADFVPTNTKYTLLSPALRCAEQWHWLAGCVDNGQCVRLSAYCHMHCHLLATTRGHRTTAFFWANKQRVVVIPYRRFGTTYRPLLLDSWSLQIEPNRVSVVIRRLNFAFGFTKRGTGFCIRCLKCLYVQTNRCVPQHSLKARLCWPSRPGL